MIGNELKVYDGLTPRQQLNLFRNLYYNDGNATEYGIIANAINDYFTADVAPKSEVAREIEALENEVGKIYNHYVFEDNDYADDDVAVEAAMNALTEVLNLIAEFREKYTEEK